MQRFSRAQQNSFAGSMRTTGDIQHEMIPIDEIHVRVATLQKQRTVPRRLSAKGMRRCIARQVSLGLDNSSSQPDAAQVVNQSFSNEIPGQGRGGFGEICPLQAAWLLLIHNNGFTTIQSQQVQRTVSLVPLR